MSFRPRYERENPSVEPPATSKRLRPPDEVIGELYEVAMRLCQQKEMGYRDALIEDLDHGGIALGLLDERFDQKLPLELASLIIPKRRGEIEFFAMMSTLWLFHLNEWLDGSQVKEIRRRYVEWVMETEPAWLGALIIHPPGQRPNFRSVRQRRIADYLECFAGVAPAIIATHSLDALYDRLTQRLLGHLGVNVWELAEDLRDSRRFLFGYSDAWYQYANEARLDFGVFQGEV